MSQLSRHSIFDIPIDTLNREEILNRISQQESEKPVWIVTANPEILLYAKKNPAYRATLQHADIRVADGTGLVAVLRMRGLRSPRIPGVELAEDVVKWASENQKRVCFIGGGSKDSAAPAFEKMKQAHPSLEGFAEQGGIVDLDGNGDTANDEARMRIMMEKPHVIFVGFGHPKQERWIEKNLLDIPGLEVVMGVGGTFDFWSGLTPRAPAWMRAIGLEWLFRLILEPKRIKRILNAVFVFPFEIIKEKTLEHR